MKRAMLLIWAVCGIAAAEEYTEFTAWMKSTGSAFHAVEKLNPKTGTEAVGNAEQLGKVYENMIAFWRQRNAADAVKWSEEGKAASTQLASAAHSGDAEAASAAFKALGGTCRSCHQAHREKTADGKYKIKE